MRANLRRLNFLLTFFAASALATFAGSIGPLYAQDQDPEPAAAQNEPAMEEAPAEEAAVEKPASDDLAAEEEKPKAAPRQKAVAKSTEPVESLPDDPAVLAILESHPLTAAELLRAIDILIDLGHAPLAKKFADELAKAKLDATAKAALASQFNSAKLLKLAGNRELGAVLGPFIDDVLKAADEYRRDPQRLATWARQLADPNESIRAQASLALIRAREAAVAPLVAILADPKQVALHATARTILVRLDDSAVQPLLGVLESPDAKLKAEVIEVLAQIRAPQAVAPLLGPLLSPASTPELRDAAAQALKNIAGHVPNSLEALRLLEHAARRLLDQSRHDPAAAAGPVEVWHWNAKRRESMPVVYDATGASLAVAARLARELYQLDSDNAASRRLYLIALLQAAKFRIGLDKPLPTGAGTAQAIAARQGVDVIDDVLSEAMAKGYLPAATAAAEILGEIGSANLLTRGATTSPLARAAQNVDRRLRFAALSAIVKFAPTQPFAGSSQVADGLGFFASSYGVPRVMVVHPRSEEARKIAGLAAELGYEVDIATNGRRAFEAATSSPDYEIIFIHSAIDRPTADELLAQLRRDKRTALLSVGLIAPLDDLDRVKRFAEGSSRTEALLQPQNPEEMKIFADRLIARAGRTLVSHEERRKQAVAALDWLVTLAQGPQKVFDVRREEPAVVQALYVPELSAQAATLLGELGTVRSQRSLVEMANSGTQPLKVRQAAATAFAHSVGRYGILLSREEILRQYDLYNANEGRDADSSAMLGAILDAIEHKGDVSSTSASNE